MNQDDPKTTDLPTIKARIAMAVSDSGRWKAGGGSGLSHRYHPDETLEDMRSSIAAEEAGTIALYWIEVEIPVPTAQVIRAKGKRVKP